MAAPVTPDPPSSAHRGRVRQLRDRWGSHHTLLGVCIGSYFAVRFAQVVIGPVVPMLIGSFEVSRGAIGLSLTGMWVAYALAQLPSGVFGDRFGEGRVVVAALGITAAAAIALATAPTFVLFALGVAALGVGAGTYYNPATALLSRRFDGVGTAVGTHRIGGQLAGVVAPVVAASVAVRYGWRPAVLIGGVLAIAVAAVFLRYHDSVEPSRPDASIRELFDPGTLLSLLARPHTRNTTAMMTLVEFVGLAAMAFLPTLLVEHFGLSIGHANVLFAVFFVVSAVSQPLGGRLSDVVGRDTTVAVQAGAGAVGYALLATGGAGAPGTPPIALALPAVVLTGIAASATPVLQSRMLDGVGDEDRGTGFGLFRTAYLLIGATGTTVVGVVADRADWTAAIGLLAVVFGAVLLSIVAIAVADRR